MNPNDTHAHRYGDSFTVPSFCLFPLKCNIYQFSPTRAIEQKTTLPTSKHTNSAQNRRSVCTLNLDLLIDESKDRQTDRHESIKSRNASSLHASNETRCTQNV